MTKQHVSRRAFLAGSAASMALGSLAGVAHAATKPQEQWDEVFDVIVIGSGLAGMCAALAAKKNGCKKVVVLEKMSYLGGNSAIATGDFGAVNSQLTRKQGIKDTPEAFAEDISAACGGLNHPDLTLTVARNSGRAIDFLIENGAKFNPEIIILGGHSAPRVHQGVESFGASVMVPIWDSFRKKYNGEIRSRVKFDSFIRDESGAVTGVNVRERYDFINESKNEDMENAGGLPKRYAARYGVVLATGGYSRAWPSAWPKRRCKAKRWPPAAISAIRPVPCARPWPSVPAACIRPWAATASTSLRKTCAWAWSSTPRPASASSTRACPVRTWP